MSQILLLTKNTLNEQTIEKRVLQLGHEVFISSSMIEQCLLDKLSSNFIEMFQIVILSETISNSETKELLNRLKHYSIKIFRKTDEQFEENQLQDWEEHGIHGWISVNSEMEVLREQMSFKTKIINSEIVILPVTRKKVPLSSLSLSAGEMKLFLILYEQHKTILPRKEISSRLWGRDLSNSTMSQLSVMVRSLRTKLSKQNIEGPIIETCWGKGYLLEESVYDQISVNSQYTNNRVENEFLVNEK